MIPRKPVASVADESVSAVSPTTATGTYSSAVSNPHSPEDIRAPSSVSSPSRTDAASPDQHFYDAPEVVPGTGPKIISSSPDYEGQKLTLGVNTDPSAAPQTMFNMDPASQPQTVGSESSPPYSSIDSDPKSGPQALNPTVFEGGEKAAEKKRPWWTRKLILVIIALVLFIVIGLAVGLGVGLTVGRNNDSGGGSGGGSGGDGTGDDNQGSPGDGEGGSTISCSGGLCPSILTPTVHDGQLNVFARTASHRLAVRTHDGDRWSSGWTDLGVVPGDGTSIVSQPAAIAWEVDDDETPRLDVFVVSSSENRVFGKHKVENNGQWSDWVDLGPGAGSAVQACRGGDDRIYLWTMDDESYNITQNFWVPGSNNEARRKLKLRQVDGDDDDDDDGEDEEEEEESNSAGSWTTTGSRWNAASSPAQGPAASAPGIACRSSNILHDLVWYDRNADRLWHQSYNDSSSSWGSQRSFDGDWVGSPSIFSYSSLSSGASSQAQRFDFFGIQSDDEVYTFSWSASDGYSDVRSLGGSIVSSPSSIQFPSSTASTRDVFALGSDGQLHHQHYDGTAWSRDWENLNITARSAPSAIVFDGAAWLFWLGEEGSLMSGRMVGNDNPGAEWADQIEVEDLGGDLTLEYFIANE